MSTAMRAPVLALVLVMANGILASCANETELTSTNARTTVKSEDASAVGDVPTTTPPEGSETPPPAAPSNNEPVIVERTFAVSKEEPLEISYDPDLGILSQDVTLRREYQAASQTFQQNTRSTLTATHAQGNSGTQHEQVFSQTQMGILDLQIIIDDSGSMASEQALLANNLPPLLSRIANANWRINIATTDYERGCSRALINRGDANAEATFTNGIKAGLDGSGNEEGIRMAVEGLRCPAILGWVREQSTVAVLIVSDEDNCSNNGGGCSNKEWKTPDYLTTNFLAKPKAQGGLGRTLGVDARVYGIIAPDTRTCVGDNNKVGYQYVTAANQTNGIIGKICDTSYETTLTRISQDISAILKSQFELAVVPDAGSLVVKVNGVEKTSGYTLAGKILTFQDPPPYGAQIKLNYTTGVTPMKTRFSLAASLPAGRSVVPSTLDVKVNGQPAAGYSYDAATKEIVFQTPPASQATINSSFKIDDRQLLTAFTLSTSAIRSGSLVVRVNNQIVSNYSHANGVVTFSAPPAEGNEIKVSYDMDKGPVLAYPISLIGTTIRNVTTIDKTTGDAVNAVYSNGVLTVAADDFVVARLLSVQYQNEASGQMKLELPHDPISGTFSIDSGRSDCVLGQSILLVGKTLTMHCAWEAGDVVVARLRYLLPPVTTFVVDGVANAEIGTWEVFVDGRATTAYSRTGASITLTATPAGNATVRIVYRRES